MDINIGRYIEGKIRNAGYSKKELCAEMNKRYAIGGKAIPYTTFSNNLKDGSITLNEAIAIATIIDIDLNNVVIAYKNKYNKNRKKDGSIKREKAIAIDTILSLLNAESIVGGIEYKRENIYAVYEECYNGYYLSEDGNTAILEFVLLDEFLKGTSEKGTITELAYFTNFLELLGESGMSLKEFKELPLSDKVLFLAKEGSNALTVLGDKEREKQFKASEYIYH